MAWAWVELSCSHGLLLVQETVDDGAPGVVVVPERIQPGHHGELPEHGLGRLLQHRGAFPRRSAAAAARRTTTALIGGRKVSQLAAIKVPRGGCRGRRLRIEQPVGGCGNAGHRGEPHDGAVHKIHPATCQRGQRRRQHIRRRDEVPIRHLDPPLFRWVLCARGGRWWQRRQLQLDGTERAACAGDAGVLDDDKAMP